MGLTISGDTADVSFYNSVELPFVFTNRDSRLRYYGRFKDDVFIVWRGSIESVTAWFEQFKRASPIFKLKLEDAAVSTVDYLDITISKGKHWKHTGFPDIAPYVKPSSRNPPLTSNSYHPRCQHASWPISRVRYYFDISTSHKAAHIACMNLIRRIEVHDPSHPSLSLLTALSKSKQFRGQSKPAVDAFTGSWLVLPYHPALLSLNRTCAHFRNLWAAESLLAPELKYLVALCPRICWSKGGQPLLSRLGGK